MLNPGPTTQYSPSGILYSAANFGLLDNGPVTAYALVAGSGIGPLLGAMKDNAGAAMTDNAAAPMTDS